MICSCSDYEYQISSKNLIIFSSLAFNESFLCECEFQFKLILKLCNNTFLNTRRKFWSFLQRVPIPGFELVTKSV